MKKFICLLLCFSLIFSVPIVGGTEEVPEAGPSVTAVSAVLIEGSTGKVLYAKDKDKELVPASITKIMTLVLIFDALDNKKIKLTDKVTVSENAAKKGGSQVYLEPGETQTVNDMIKCICIASANDAAAAMAEKIAGSESAFVERMNAKAKKLGMKHTQFKNCTGLDDDITSGHYTSAYDVALMSREVITKHPEISKFSTTWMDKITHVTKKGSKEFGLTNTNKLVRFYQGITGLKTGSTSKAKYCLSATANRNGMDLIAVIMAAPDVKARFAEATTLLDYGFSNCALYQEDFKNMQTAPQKISGGMEDIISLVPEKTFTYVFTDGADTSKVEKKISYQESISAPIKKGAPYGTIEYQYNGRTLGKVNLVATKDINQAGFGHVFSQLLNHFFKH